MKLLAKTNEEYKLSSLKTILSGGCYVANSLKERMKKYFPDVNFLIAYGMSEVGGGFTMSDDGFGASNTVGTLLKNMKAKV